MRIPLNIVGQAYAGRDRSVDSEVCINFYPETNTSSSKSVSSLIGTPGSRRWVTLPVGKLRDGIKFKGQLWVVSGNRLYMTKDKKYFEKGILSTFVGSVSMAENGNQLLIVDGTYMYIYDMSGNSDKFLKLNSVDVPPNPITCDYIDGYFTVNEGNTGRFWLSDFNNGLIWNGLKFATAEGSPDNLIALKVFGRNIWLFGDTTTEIWYNSGNRDFSFARMQGAYIEAGILAPFSIAKTDTNIFWLGRTERGDGAIYTSSNGSLRRISTTELELIIDCQDLSTVTAFTYYNTGHTFYCITFPSIERTFCYDMSTGMWHERSTEGNRWIGSDSVTVNGELFALDKKSNRILIVDEKIYTDDGSPIVRTRRTQHNQSNRQYLEANSVEIEFNRMQNTNTIKSPSVSFRVSRDGGYRWSRHQVKDIGVVGNYTDRVKFNRLGTGRDFVFEVTVSDPVKWVMVDAFAEAVVVQ